MKQSHNHFETLCVSLISHIDTLINQQLNVVLHHPKLQGLEASWRGLALLTQQTRQREQQVKIKCLDISYREFADDLSHASEFDQSQMFRKVYSAEFDQAGGEPYGLLIGDFYITHKITPQGIDGISTLREMAKVAAASFCPFIAGAAPELFGLDHFAEFKPNLNMSSLFKLGEYQRWLQLRKQDDVRFIGLCLPRVNIRAPYNVFGEKNDHLFFKETINQSDDLCWANACFAYAEVVIKAFCRHGWFGEIRGLNPHNLTGGLVNNLPRLSYQTMSEVGAKKPVTEVLITDRQEKLLSEYGFMALKDQPVMQQAVFYHCCSIQQPQYYDRLSANANANLSSQLNYMLCIARFAHYIKKIIRDKIGLFMSEADCEQYLQRWILNYCTANDSLDEHVKAQRPLRSANIEIKALQQQAGVYHCLMHLIPHYQIEYINTSLRLVTPMQLVA